MATTEFKCYLQYLLYKIYLLRALSWNQSGLPRECKANQPYIARSCLKSEQNKKTKNPPNRMRQDDQPKLKYKKTQPHHSNIKSKGRRKNTQGSCHQAWWWDEFNHPRPMSWKEKELLQAALWPPCVHGGTCLTPITPRKAPITENVVINTFLGLVKQLSACHQEMVWTWMLGPLWWKERADLLQGVFWPPTECHSTWTCNRRETNKQKTQNLFS